MQVLVTGGYGGTDRLASAELYDPAAGTWAPTGCMTDARYLQTATLLPGGKVLVTGGFNNSGILASAEPYDPAASTWAPPRSSSAENLPSPLPRSSTRSPGRTCSSRKRRRSAKRSGCRSSGSASQIASW